MKRVMSAPVGALRASQQQIGPANSSAGAIGTAAYHPRSPNVALDPVRCPPSPPPPPLPPLSLSRECAHFSFLSLQANVFCLFVSSNQEGALEAGGQPAFTAKFPDRRKAFATGRVWEAAQGVAADGTCAASCRRVSAARAVVPQQTAGRCLARWPGVGGGWERGARAAFTARALRACHAPVLHVQNIK
jgi:hypothetical protein